MATYAKVQLALLTSLWQNKDGTKEYMTLPVLGLWKDEGEFRDYLAANIARLEAGLSLIEAEHTLSNASGAGGRVDILAQDSLGNYVCIEVKRSDNSARATLNELSKYLVLFCNENDLPKERVRCILVSTHWHEVRLPLSVFADMSGADVSGYEATAHDGELCLCRQELHDIEFSPQISPEICVLYFADEVTRKQHLLRVEERIAQLPFLRVAMLELDPKPGSISISYVAVTYLWKIPVELYPEIETVIGHELGWLSPYAHPNSIAETDTSYWLFEEDDDCSIFYSGSARFGTPEKVSNLLERFAFKRVEKVGNWQPKDVVNTDQKLLSQMTSYSSLTGGAKQNDHSYFATTRPQLKNGYKREVSGFLEFLSFSSVFKSAAGKFLVCLETAHVEVCLEANRGRNTFIELYMSSRVGRSQLASFQIIVTVDGKITEGLAGGYYWDGKRMPQDPESNMDTAFGGVSLMIMKAFSSAEWDADEDTLALHGLIPAVFKLSNDTQDLVSRGGDIDSLLLPFNDFERINRPYIQDLVRLINSVSDLGSVDFSPEGE